MRANPDADPTKDNHFTEEDAQAIISAFDDNGDGVLSIEELVAAWSTIGGSNEKLCVCARARARRRAHAEPHEETAVLLLRLCCARATSHARARVLMSPGV